MRILLKGTVYILCFIMSMQAMQAMNYEKMLKPNHVRQAQVLYFLLVISLAYLSGSFVCVFLGF